MNQKKAEKTQKRNPYQLTKKQHCFPARSIERFASSDKTVDLYRMGNDKRIRVKTDNPIFCADRLWNHGAENTYMKTIEYKYQKLADSIVLGNKKTLKNDDYKIVTDMYLLWDIRELVRQQDRIADAPLDVKTEVSLSKDDEELLELNNIQPTDKKISGRDLTATFIRVQLFNGREALKDTKWGIIRAKEGQFIVPDSFLGNGVLPLAPSVLFLANFADGEINKLDVGKINKLALSCSKSYYFAKNLEACFV